MAFNTTTQVPPAVATFYDRILLKRALPKLVHEKFADKKPIPAKSGNTIKFRKYASLGVAKTPLSEGVNPASQTLSVTDITATIQQYGGVVGITDVVDLTVEDATLTETHELLAEQMGETLDEITRDVLVATASVTNASHGSNGNTPTEITKTDIDAVIQTLLNENAEMISSIIPATTGVGTQPVRAAYFGIISTELIDDLEAVSNFKSVAEYPRQTDVQDAEWGSTGNVRWLATTKAYNDGGSPKKYSCVVMGRHAYATTQLDRGTVASIVKGFGSAGTADPLNLQATAGWKAMYVAEILNDAFLNNLKVTHS